MLVEQLNRFVRKTSTKKKMRLLICCVAALSTISFIYYSPSSSVQNSDKILHRHIRDMKPMIDMRGFPDTKGLCQNVGYFQNKTDCTQFYRCVDLNRKGKYTVFRFMCGAGTAFDQRRSVCVWPKMAVCGGTPDPTPPTPTPTPSIPTNPTPTAPPTPPTPSTPPTPTPITSPPPTPPTPSSPPTPSTPPTPTPLTSPPPTPSTPSIPSTTPIPPTPPPPPPPTPPPPPPPTPNKCQGILKVEDESIQPTGISGIISLYPNTVSGIISCSNRTEIVLIQDGPEQTITLPPETIFSIITINEGYGSVTNISNKIFTTNSTEIYLPSFSTYEVIQFVEGQKFNRTTLFVTQKGTSKILVPEMSIFGEVELTNNQVTNIGGYRFTTAYINTDKAKYLTFGILSSVTTLQTTVSTNSKGFSGNEQFISGIITVGGSADDNLTNNSLSYTLSVTKQDLLVIIPKKGKGTITLIEEQSRNSTEFLVTPGTVLTIQPPADLDGMVTNLLQKLYTSVTTEILFPAGSTVSVSRIRIDGKLEKISAVQVSSTFAVLTITQSIIGIIQTSSEDVIRKIGSAYFDVKLVNESLDETYIGVLNLNSLKREDQSVTGIIQIGDPSVLNYQQSTTVQTIQILPNTISAVIASGKFVITEEYETSIKQTVVSIPSGGIFGIFTQTKSGEISGISNGYFTTSFTQLVFPSGVQFGTVRISPYGAMLYPQNPVETTVRTTISVPAGGIFGEIILSGRGMVKRIGNAFFSTRYLVVDHVLLPEPTTQLGLFGIIYFDEKFDLPKSIATSSTKLNQLPNISGIFHLPVRNRLDLIDSLSVEPGSSLAIIPNTGQGVVTVNEGNSSSDFTILPGQMFGVFGVQDAKITYIRDGFFTTKTTSMTFSSGTMYGVVKIGLDASILVVESISAQSDMYVTVREESTIGKLDLIRPNDGRLTVISVGGAPFVIRNLTSTQNSANAAIGIIGINDLPPPTTTTTTTPIPTPSSTTPTTTTSTPIPTPSTPTIPLPTPPPVGPFDINCSSSSSLYQYPLDCSRFYQCFTEGDNRDIYVLPCRSDLYFDEVTSSCRNPNETVCTDRTSINATSSSGGIMHLYCDENLYRYPLNCNSFYTCIKDGEQLSTITVFSCVGGLVFDDSSRNCLAPNETLPCEDNENLFKSPTFGFQWGEKIDAESLLSTSRDIFEKQKTNLSKQGELSDLIVPKLPLESGRGANQSKTEIHTSTNIEIPY